MLRISAGLTLLTALLIPVLCALARKRWRSSGPALWPHRVALGGVVWAVLWVILNLPGTSSFAALLPVVICSLGFAYIAVGNRRRGYQNPRVLVPVVSAIALGVAALFLVGAGIRARNHALAAEAAARVAEGQRAQDSFNALVHVDDTTIAIIGTTSTEPNDADDVWVYALDIDGGLLNATTYQRPGDQVGFTLALNPDGSWMLGGRDEENPFLARATPEGITHYHRWDTSGSLSVLHALEDARFIAGGGTGDTAWIGVIDQSGREHWRNHLDTGIQNAQVTAVAVVGERFVAVGSDDLFSRGAFLVGGALAGRVEWIKTFGGESDATCALTHVRANSDGTFVALGRRSQAAKLEDLWLLHFSSDGTILNGFTFGDSLGEYSGGLAVRGDDVIVVGHRFTGLDSELWMQAVDLSGSVKWERTYPNSRFGRASDVVALPNGDMLVVGNRTPDVKSDAWIARFDRNGEEMWQRTYPPDNGESKSKHGTPADSVSPLWGGLNAGPYSVGFDVVRRADSSRVFRPVAIDGAELPPIPRPIQISVWYPAVAGAHSTTVVFADYAALLGTEGRAAVLDTVASAAGCRELASYLVSLGASEPAVDRLLRTPSGARRSVTRARGRFPVVVILAGKDGSPLEHVVLAEYLASHGFLVAATPAMGAGRRAMAWTAEDVRAQVADLATVLRNLQSYPGTDVTRIGLIGFSFGAGSAIIASQEHGAVRAIVSLDGSIGFRDRIPVYRSMPLVRSPGLPPVLHFNVLGEERNEIGYLDSLASTVAVASLAGADHLALTSLGMFPGAVRDLELAPFHAVSDPVRVHTIVVTMARAFLAAHLQDRPEEWAAVTRASPRLGSWPPEAGQLRP
jgi:hypothetical protein